jgi:SAM-dependent methyltransferase
MVIQEQPDQAAIDAATMRMVGYLGGAAVTAGVMLGHQIGFYTHLAGAGPLTAGELAARAGTNERLTREWLDSQAAGRILAYDGEADTYELDDATAMVVADQSSPVFLAGGLGVVRTYYMDMDHVADAARGDGSFGWDEHHHGLFEGTGRFFRQGYLNFLTSAWIPSVEGLVDRLQAGAKVLDVGCGVGYSSIFIAEAFPNVTVTGIDYHPGSIDLAREEARSSLAANRLSFEVADATSYDGEYDLICFFDCLHDLGDPVGAAQHAKRHLAQDGVVLLVEPWALDDRASNIESGPFAALFYTGSTFLCTPNALSQAAGPALGAQAGEARLRAVFQEAGFESFERTTETPFNIVLAARA